MLPIGFADVLGLSVADVAALGPEATALVQLLEVARGIGKAQGVFMRFVNMVRRGIPGLSWDELSARYRAAKYFDDQASYLAKYDPDMMIDRRLARVQETATGLGPQGENFRYRVTVTVIFPGTGESREFGVWVPSSDALTPREATELGLQSLFSHFKPRSRPMDFGGEVEGAGIYARLVDFTRFAPQV